MRRLVMTAAADPAPGGAKEEPKKEERPIPQQHPAPKEKPPELAADALNAVSKRLDALEKKPITTVGVGGVFLVVLLAVGLVLGLGLLAARFLRRPEEAPAPQE